MKELVALLVPIFICVVLPIAIVGIVSWAQIRKQKQKSQIIMEAFKHSDNVDINRLAKLLGNNGNIRTPRQRLSNRLFAACACAFTGIAIATVSILSLDPRETLYDIVEVVTAGTILFGVGLAFFISFLFGYKNLAAEEREYNEMKKELEN